MKYVICLLLLLTACTTGAIKKEEPLKLDFDCSALKDVQRYIEIMAAGCFYTEVRECTGISDNLMRLGCYGSAWELCADYGIGMESLLNEENETCRSEFLEGEIRSE